jgi:hypothetical protein
MAPDPLGSAAPSLDRPAAPVWGLCGVGYRWSSEIGGFIVCQVLGLAISVVIIIVIIIIIIITLPSPGP